MKCIFERELNRFGSLFQMDKCGRRTPIEPLLDDRREGLQRVSVRVELARDKSQEHSRRSLRRPRHGQTQVGAGRRNWNRAGDAVPGRRRLRRRRRSARSRSQFAPKESARP